MKLNRLQLNRSQAETVAAPAWVVTYADFMTLLLCLFVAILSMSTIRQDRFQTALGSLQSVFGEQSSLESIEAPDRSIYGKLHKFIEKNAATDSTQSGVASNGHWATVTNIPQGARVVLAGPLVFERGRAELREDAKQTLARVAIELTGRVRTIVIRGHCAGESQPGDQGTRDLSYARAAAAARILEQGGVPGHAISVVALGDSQPFHAHAYSEKRRAMNRRVEIDIVESDEPGEAVHPTTDEKG